MRKRERNFSLCIIQFAFELANQSLGYMTHWYFGLDTVSSRKVASDIAILRQRPSRASRCATTIFASVVFGSILLARVVPNNVAVGKPLLRRLAFRRGMRDIKPRR
ncbi:hypothetical protein [Novipirellula sp.]|uniref:hypothetical protein n=1 Tax=Novipirellula sp. TaxID=2795430 RepID=UPI003568246C